MIGFSLILIIGFSTFISAACSESDGGRIYEVKGTTTSGSISKPDSCLPNGYLSEQYCSGNQVLSASYNCGAGKTCNDGKCEAMCQDTSIVLGTKGVVHLGAADYTDSCVVEFGNIQKYYYCASDDVYRSSNYLCPVNSFCYDGGCTTNCVDPATTEGEKGTTRKGTTIMEDTCSSLTNQTYYYCGADGGITSGTYACPTGKVCYNGECISSASVISSVPGCVDTDGGFNIYSKGNVSIDKLIQTDSCIESSSSIVEYFCYEDKISSIVYSCQGTCVDGACTLGDIFGFESCVDSTNVLESSCNAETGILQTTTIPCDISCVDGVCTTDPFEQGVATDDSGNCLNNDYSCGTTSCADCTATSRNTCGSDGDVYSESQTCSDNACVYSGAVLTPVEDCQASGGGYCENGNCKCVASGVWEGFLFNKNRCCSGSDYWCWWFNGCFFAHRKCT
jgi:hypothetical protein